MSEMKEYIISKYEDFWYDIYNIEKEEFIALKQYMNYVQKELRNYKMFSYEYDSIKNLFMNKHLDYLNEAFSCLLLGNYNAFSCLMRIIIENYTSFILIKKYKNKNIWIDWYLFGVKKTLNMVSEPYRSKMLEKYKKLCDIFKFDDNIFDNMQSYGWLKRCIKLKNYSFKNVCKEIDYKVYADFEYLSSYIHNNDIISKNIFVDMQILSKFLFLMYDYTNKIIKEYNYHFLQRNYYNYLCTNLLDSINTCCNYKENLSIF